MDKKFFAVVCAVVMAMGVMCSCSEKNDTESSSKAEDTPVADSSSDIEKEPDTDKPDDEQTTDDETTAESDITPAMWQVTGDNGAVVTFVGSMHALNESDYPMPAKMTDAFESSEILAVEADISKTASITFQASLLAAMFYDDPTDNLRNHISDEAYDALDKYLKEFSMSAASMELFQPWAVDNTVENLVLEYSELSAEYGLDSYFMELARNKNVEIFEVEGVDFQMDMLMNFSDEIYDLIFRSFEGETKESQLELLNETHTAWITGDIEAIGELDESADDLSDEDMAIVEDYNNQMLYDRNVGMAEAAKQFINGDKNVFFIVGAAHFAGDKGIIALLENDGYEVVRIEY